MFGKMYHFSHESFFDINPEDSWDNAETDFNDFKTDENIKRPLRETNFRKGHIYKHVPHKDRPPQAVEKRNARERRRVQAVNSAFVKLRNVIPIQNTRGKRISKVKTLLHAIEYIRILDQLLQNCETFACSYQTEKLQYETCDYNIKNKWDAERHIDEFFH